MDPVTAATDVSGAISLIQGVAQAAAQGNYWWVISAIVFVLLELAQGNVPGTNIKIPYIPQLIKGQISDKIMRLIALGASAVVAGIFVLSGMPVAPAVADFAIGWLGAMGLHNAATLLKPSKPANVG
jgi:hypothetical protein